jgi:hypothetical protein
MTVTFLIIREKGEGRRFGQINPSMKVIGKQMLLGDTAGLAVPMETPMKDSGSKIMPTAMECLRIDIMRSMRDTGRWISLMVGANRLGATAVPTMETMLMVESKAKASTSPTLVKFTKAN